MRGCNDPSAIPHDRQMLSMLLRQRRLQILNLYAVSVDLSDNEEISSIVVNHTLRVSIFTDCLLARRKAFASVGKIPFDCVNEIFVTCMTRETQASIFCVVIVVPLLRIVSFYWQYLKCCASKSFGVFVSPA